MNLNDYTKLALRTANSMDSELNDLVHAAMGMAGESGEVLDLVKKSFAYGKAIDKVKLIEEAGDALWYFNLLFHTLNVSWEEVMERNITKLEGRYPDLRFDSEHAINNR